MKLVSKKNGTMTIFPNLISAVANKIGFTPPTGMSATNVQSAIEELSPVIKINDPSIVLSKTIAIHPTLLVGSNNPGNGGDTIYYKIGTKVSLNISIQGIPSGAASTIFNLPVGYRPHSTIIVNGMGGSSGSACDILIYATGDVVISIPTGESYCEGYVTFDAFDPS